MWTMLSPRHQHHCQHSQSLWACRVREKGKEGEREREGEREKERERERERERENVDTSYNNIITLLVYQGMLVNDSLGRQIMKLQQLILTSEVS